MKLTKLLVSIRNELEASIAADFPIDILDVKEPDRGALGPVDTLKLKRIIANVDRDQCMSVALGEIRDQLAALRGGGTDATVIENVFGDKNLVGEFRFAKIGLAGMKTVPGWQNHWLEFSRQLPKSMRPVGVAYLDHECCDCPTPGSVLELVAECSTGVLLLDTFSKKSGNAISLMGVSGLKQLLHRARRNDVKTVVAGSVAVQNLQILLPLNPDFIGVRGAVCTEGRRQLDRLKLARFCRQFAAISSRGFNEIRNAGS